MSKIPCHKNALGEFGQRQHKILTHNTSLSITRPTKQSTLTIAPIIINQIESMSPFSLDANNEQQNKTWYRPITVSMFLHYY